MNDLGQQQFEPQLAVKRIKKLRPLNGPGIFWSLIVITLVLAGTAISFLDNSEERELTSTISATPEPRSVDAREPRIYTVTYKGGVFSPTNLRIHSGDTVRFKNEGFFGTRITSDPHPEHNNLVGFDSVGDIPQGSFFSFTFAAKGIFSYHNEKTPKETGTIIVR